MKEEGKTERRLETSKRSTQRKARAEWKEQERQKLEQKLVAGKSLEKAKVEWKQAIQQWQQGMAMWASHLNQP